MIVNQLVSGMAELQIAYLLPGLSLYAQIRKSP